MKSVVIVQARLGSTRLPRKVLMDLGGFPMVEIVLSRCLSAGADEVVLAVPDHDLELAAVARAMGIRVSYGPEDDVLARYVWAARASKADIIMRITADCPLIEPKVMSAVLNVVKRGGVDYCSNVMPRSFEKGLDCEAFTRWALELAGKKATTKYDREHVTTWIQRNKRLNKINVESGEPGRADINWSVDTAEDLEVVRLEWARRYPE